MFQRLFYIFNQNHKKIVDELKTQIAFLKKELHETQIKLVDAVDKNEKMRKEVKQTREYAESVYNKYCYAEAYAKKEMDRCINNHKLMAGDVEKLEREIKELEKVDMKIAHNHKKYLIVSG